jgi:hypothetical protein
MPDLGKWIGKVYKKRRQIKSGKEQIEIAGSCKELLIINESKKMKATGKQQKTCEPRDT